MERILVAIHTRHGGWEALSHACSLAKRMTVELHVLLVMPPEKSHRSFAQAELQSKFKQRVMLHIEKAKNEGIQIQTYITEGNYADEIISFTTSKNISLLISEIPGGTNNRPKKEATILETLKHRLSCRLEVVTQKRKYLL
jgi:K+-sensing histidine kinase KdpD